MHHGSHTDSYDEQHMITMDAEQRDSGDTDGQCMHSHKPSNCTAHMRGFCCVVKVAVNDLSIVLCVEFLISISKFFLNTQNEISAKWKYTQLVAKRQAVRSKCDATLTSPACDVCALVLRCLLRSGG